jgi:ketopantoate reductase
MNEVAINEHLNKLTVPIDIFIGDINLRILTANGILSEENRSRRMIFDNFLEAQNLIWEKPNGDQAIWDHLFVNSSINVLAHEYNNRDKESMKSDHGSLNVKYNTSKLLEEDGKNLNNSIRYRINRLRHNNVKRMMGDTYDSLTQNLNRELQNNDIDVDYIYSRVKEAIQYSANLTIGNYKDSPKYDHPNKTRH